MLQQLKCRQSNDFALVNIIPTYILLKMKWSNNNNKIQNKLRMETQIECNIENEILTNMSPKFGYHDQIEKKSPTQDTIKACL